MGDFIKDRKKWKLDREGPRVEWPSVRRAREEFEEAVDSGDFGKVKEALMKLRGAQIYQLKRLR